MIRPQDKTFWFGRTFREFSALTLPYAGKPITYVEVGTWMADSCHWMMENVLTHPDSFGYGIDPYPDDFKRGSNEPVKEIAAERMSKFKNWTWIYAKSQDGLRMWDSMKFGYKIDVLYLDGSHLAHDVVMDWCFAWPHLRNGSLVIFDDYGLSKRKTDGVLRVDVAVDAIEKSFAPFIERVGAWKLQAAFKVTKEPIVGQQPGEGMNGTIKY